MDASNGTVCVTSVCAQTDIHTDRHTFCRVEFSGAGLSEVARLKNSPLCVGTNVCCYIPYLFEWMWWLQLVLRVLKDVAAMYSRAATI